MQTPFFWQEAIGVTLADGALVSGNTISGASVQDIGAYGATKSRILVNDLVSTTHPFKILLNDYTSDCLVVTDDPSMVLDNGTDNKIVSPND
jgi:hypothetical protein